MTAPLSVKELLAAHPWPPEHAAAPRLEWLWHFELPLPKEELWPFIADTSRMNRALGVAEMTFEDWGTRRWGRSEPAGVLHEWEEVPWNWVAGEWIESVRLYERGFARVVYGVFVLTSLGPRSTRVSVYFGAVPRGLVGRVALALGFPTLEKDFRRVFGELAAHAAEPAVVFQLPGPGALSEQAEARLGEARARLVDAGLDAALVDRVLEWLRVGDEEDLHRIQLRARARAWGVDEHALLRLALHGTRAGLFEIHWDTICPHCRGATHRAETLGAVSARGACPICEIDFATDTEQAVEITFSVHPSIRAVAHHTYCSAEPATKQHIRVQRDVPPGASLELPVELAPGTYRLRLHGREDYGYLDAREGGPPRVEWRAAATTPLEARPDAELALRNDTEAPQRFIVEAARWSDLALRPAQLFSLQDYRDLFSEDYLAADVQLAIGEQTILFTDIVGSTAMYATRGDPAAFIEVKRHFAEVFAVVAEHGGAVVKTIGDAVMAAFCDPLDAVRAAGALHERFHAERSDTPTRLRISLNTGPCIAVQLNTGVDYFGQTVNLAAKLQSLADAGDVALSLTTYAGRGVPELLSGLVEDTAYESPALASPVPAKRWRCFAARR